MMETRPPLHIPVDQARTLAEEILNAVGAADDDASRVVDSLIYADRRGVGTHGLIRLKFYVDRVRSGGIDPDATVELVRESDATALLDSGNGFGAVATTRALELAIDKASKAGAGVVAARNMNHFGAAAYYATMAAEQNMVGVVMTNVTASMAPTGGTDVLVGNNPIAFAFPSSDSAPVIFDAATSRSSWGALLRAAQRGEPLAPDAFLGPNGMPSREPDAVLAGGSLLPIEGYKGYGLALCIALLTGVLTGGEFDSEIAHPYRHLEAPGGNSILAIAIPVDGFVGADAFAGRVGDLSETIRSGATAPGVDRVMVPGDRENAAAQAAGETISLEHETVEQLEALGTELGVAVDLVEVAQ
jgi:L-2-hydroxycarboxylate dehydrogenase (NAD+)